MYLQGIPWRPVVRTPHFHCRGSGFHPWSGNYDPTSHTVCPPPKNVPANDKYQDDSINSQCIRRDLTQEYMQVIRIN